MVFGVWAYLQLVNRPAADKLRPYIAPFIAAAPLRIWLPSDMVDLIDRFDFRECCAMLREKFDETPA